MIKYHQYRGTIQEESEVNWDRLLLKAHQENFKDPRNDRIKEKVERCKTSTARQLGAKVYRMRCGTLSCLALDLL